MVDDGIAQFPGTRSEWELHYCREHILNNQVPFIRNWTWEAKLFRSPESAENHHGCRQGHQRCAVANRVQGLDGGVVHVLKLEKEAQSNVFLLKVADLDELSADVQV